MFISNPNHSMGCGPTIEQLKQLWLACFEDDESFVDLFFARAYSPRSLVAIEERGEPVSALYILPRTLVLQGRKISAGYIYGVATHPLCRGRGLMKQLFAEAHRRMQERGMEWSLLIPADEGLRAMYGRMGYLSLFSRSTQLYTPPCAHPLSCGGQVHPVTQISPQLFRLFSHEMSRRPCCVLHDADDLDFCRLDIEQSGGDVWTLVNNDTPQAAAFCIKEEDVTVVRECVYRRLLDRDHLLDEVCRRMHTSQAMLRVAGSDFLTGMAFPLSPHCDFSSLAALSPYMSLMLDE